MITARRWTLLLALVVAAGGCKKSDAERAAAERAEMAKRLVKSHALVPYRGLKTLLRSRGTQPPPAELEELLKLIEQTREPPAEATAAAALYFKIALGLYKARKAIDAHDEDGYPTLWAGYTGQPQPAPWYDAPFEHLLVADAIQVMALADRSGRVPLPDVILYELSRGEAKPGWPWAGRALAKLERGMVFCQADYHYAAEEELTGFIDEWERVPPADLALMAAFLLLQPDQTMEIGRATGHFLRAWNRMGLGRDKAADEDLQAALDSLKKIGVDNEATQWGWALLYYRQGKYVEAGQSLEKLSKSPYLDEEARKGIAESAQGLEKTGKNIPVFSRTRAAGLIVSALLARVGGLEKVLITLLGEERGKKAYAPVAWLNRLQEGVGGIDEAKLVEGVGGAADKTKELGAKGLELLKSKVDEAKK